MAVPKALLTSPGSPKGTATEHATSAFQSGSTATERATSASQSGSTATERATKHDSLLPLTGLPATRKKAIEEGFHLELC